MTRNGIMLSDVSNFDPFETADNTRAIYNATLLRQTSEGTSGLRFRLRTLAAVFPVFTPSACKPSQHQVAGY